MNAVDISAEARKRFRQMKPMRGVGTLAAHLPVGVIRAMSDGMGGLATEPEGVQARPAADLAPSLRATWLRPRDGRGDVAVLYLHGGGYVAGSFKSHRRMIGHLARASGTPALFLDYRLAPENPFPAGLQDAVAAYRALLGAFAPERLAVAGDSAGGGMTLALLQQLKRLGLPQPAAAVALSPMTDFTFSGASWRTNAKADVLMTRSAAEAAARRVTAGGVERRDPRLSPLFGELSGLAPVLLQVGGDECLRDDSTAMAARLEAAGGAAVLEVYPGMQHVFQTMAGSIPEADRAIASIAAFLQARLATAGASKS